MVQVFSEKQKFINEQIMDQIHHARQNMKNTYCKYHERQRLARKQ